MRELVVKRFPGIVCASFYVGSELFVATYAHGESFWVKENGDLLEAPYSKILWKLV